MGVNLHCDGDVGVAHKIGRAFDIHAAVVKHGAVSVAEVVITEGEQGRGERPQVGASAGLVQRLAAGSAVDDAQEALKATRNGAFREGLTIGGQADKAVTAALRHAQERLI